jgi:chloramphenicol 3-O-phosphotransferase
MIVLLNGAFGIGKTTVARLVVKRLPGTALFDPEKIGFVLQRVRKLIGRPVDDFQDLASWRRLLILGLRATRKIRRNVIVPMTFSNVAYLEEVRSGIARFEPHVLHLCLVAPVEVVHDRRTRRGFDATEWEYRRAAECCDAHRDAAFAEHLPTAGLTAEEVADRVLARMTTAHPRGFES